MPRKNCVRIAKGSSSVPFRHRRERFQKSKTDQKRNRREWGFSDWSCRMNRFGRQGSLK